jgi:HEAT repeat protein
MRATAAYALSQIPHPRAAEVLISLEKDSDPRVREVVQKVLKPSPAKKPVPRVITLPSKRDGAIKIQK